MYQVFFPWIIWDILLIGKLQEIQEDCSLAKLIHSISREKRQQELEALIPVSYTHLYIKHPLEAVSVGDVVDVMVLGVDMKKKRISLTMKGIK